MQPAPANDYYALQGSQSKAIRVSRSAASGALLGAKQVALVGLGKASDLATPSSKNWGPPCFQVKMCSSCICMHLLPLVHWE